MSCLAKGQAPFSQAFLRNELIMMLSAHSLLFAARAARGWFSLHHVYHYIILLDSLHLYGRRCGFDSELVSHAVDLMVSLRMHPCMHLS